MASHEHSIQGQAMNKDVKRLFNAICEAYNINDSADNYDYDDIGYLANIIMDKTNFYNFLHGKESVKLKK